MATFGKRLLRLREKRGIDQTKLGEILNLSKSTISMYEKDSRSPSPETLVLLAQYFDVTVDYLLRGDIRNQNEIIQEEVSEFMDRYNKLGQYQKEIIKERLEELMTKLENL